MNRRQFMQMGSFLTVTAATMGLSACGGGGGSSGSGSSSASGTFPQGIASADPKPDSIILWARCAPASGTPDQVALSVEVSTTADFANLIVNQPLTALATWDYTVRNKVTNLQPGTTYYYRFRSGSTVSVTGRTKTAPAAGTPVAQMKFAFITCQDWSVNHWAAFDEMVTQDLDFVVHLGDYIYETVGAGFQSSGSETRHPALTLPDGKASSKGGFFASTTNDYRYLYRTYRTDPRLQALHARFPFVHIWDDHEFSDDCWQDRQNYIPGEDGNSQTPRRRNANQAWYEYIPADINQLDVANPSFQNLQIYRTLSFGSLATLVMTDERLYRADHIIPESAVPGGASEIGSRYFVPKTTLAQVEAGKMATASSGGLNPLTNVSMLGNTQRQWWKDQMSAAKTTWKLWGNEVSLLRMGFDGTKAVAALLAQGLIQSLAAAPFSINLSSQAAQITGALYLDLAAANKSGATPVVTYTNTSGLIASLTSNAISPSTFTTYIKPGLDSSLPPSMFLDQYVINADQWDGYNSERKDLMAHLKSNAIGNVVALTGDLHSIFAGQVMDDYDAASPTPVMVDLVTGGISSNSLFSYFKSVVDSSAAFGKAKPLIYTTNPDGSINNTFNTTLTSFNGNWIKFVETDAQGYAIVTLTPAQMSCEFHKMKPAVNGVAPALPASTIAATIKVAAGSTAITVQ